MEFEPMTRSDLVGCCNHWATGDSVVSKGQIVGIDWNRIARPHGHVLTHMNSDTYSGGYLWLRKVIAWFALY